MSRWSRGLAASHEANTSWSIKWAVKQENGSLRRWRIHYNASLQRPGTSEEHKAARAQARENARAKAKALTEDPTVVWVTVYPPFKAVLFRNNDWSRLAPVSRWTRKRGWWTTEEEE